jgi:hypothetical protein
MCGNIYSKTAKRGPLHQQDEGFVLYMLEDGLDHVRRYCSNWAVEL